MSNSPVFEIALLPDLSSIFEMINNAFRGTHGPVGWTNEVGLLSGPRLDIVAFTLMADNPDILFFALKEEGSLLGSVALRDLGEGVWYLSLLAVDPAVQARGLGKRIVQAAEDFVRQRGGSSIELSVVAQRESLIAWYGRRGYVHSGRSEPFPYGDPAGGTPLRNDLFLLILVKQLIHVAEP